MKKWLIAGIILLFLIILGYLGYHYYQEYRIKHATIEVNLVDDLDILFRSKVKASDLIVSLNGEITKDNYIDTLSLGKKKVSIEYINDENIKINYDFEVNIVDKTPPVIWLSDTYTVKMGSKIDLVNIIMCGDNYDDNPYREIVGEYDLEKIGTYPLIYKAIDQSGNVSIKNFKLVVKKNITNSSSYSTINFKDIYKEYKNENTKIGLDVSKWQGEIDYHKVKEAGVEFVFIKIGGSNGLDGDYYIDPYFKRNIEGFLNEGINVGGYFYSYANSKEKARDDALWVIEQIKDYDISLPIAYDWENWSSYNKFNMSFHHLTESAMSFINTLENNGYKGILYSSKNYLEKIWLLDDYSVWLAHYTKKTDYQGKYLFWQMTSRAVIPGITTNTVDVDIMYLT